MIHNLSVQRPYPLRLGSTYHVGEDVEDLLTGLRHLEEVAVLLFGGKPGRLGHALALGEDPRRFYARRGDETEVRVGTHLLDLVWAYGRLLGHDARGMIDCIKHRIAVVGRVQFRRGRDLDTCLDAMDLDTMSRSERPTLSSEAELLDKLGFCGDAAVWCSVQATFDWLAMVTKVQSLLRQRFARLPLCIEANPTSNLLIGGYTDYGALPYAAFTDAGLAVSINTDDPGLFCTTLPGEFSALYHAWCARTGSHRAAVQWLEDRLRDAKSSTFLGAHVPIGRDALRRAPSFGHFVPEASGR